MINNPVNSKLANYLLRIYQLKDVIRYNCRCHLKDESVAEHSFYVALIALGICDKFKLNDTTKSQCLIKALLHDMPEMDLNDITHNVKERLNLRPMLKQYEDEYYGKYYPQHYVLMAAGTELINTIVEYADALSVYQFVLNEKRLGNNSGDIKEITTEAIKRIQNLYTKLKCLIGERK